MRIVYRLAAVLWAISGTLIIFSSYRLSPMAQVFACVLIALLFLMEGARLDNE